MKLNRKLEQQIIDHVQDAYDNRDLTEMFCTKVKFNTFVVEVDEWDNELYATVMRKSDGKIYNRISDYVEQKLLYKYIKLD